VNIGDLTASIGLESSGIGEGLSGVLEKLSDFGGKAGKILAGIGAGGAVALGAGLAGAMDFQDANAKMAASLGSNAKQAGELGTVAGKVYAGGFGDSMEGVTDAVKGVVQNIGNLGQGESLDVLSEKALNLSKVFDVDVKDATIGAGQLMKTGLAKNATEAFDIITAGFQAGDDKAGDFLDTLNEYGTQFRKLGIDGTTATGLISQGLQAGARDGDLVADAIKEFSIRAVDGTQTTAQGFEALGLSATKTAEDIGKGGKPASDALQLVLDKLRGMKDPVQQAQAATALFGTQAEDLGAALFALDPAHAVDALGQVGGAADKMGQTLNATASSNIQTFMRQAQVAFVDIVGGKVLPAFTAFTGYLSTNFGPALSTVISIIQTQVIPAAQDMAHWIDQNRGPLEVVGAIIAAIFVPGLIAMAVNATIAKTQVVAAWIAQKVEAISSVAAQSASIYLAITDWVMMAGAASVNAAKVVAGWVMMSAGAIAEGIAMSASVVATAAVWVAGWVLMGVQSLLQAARMAAAWLIAMGPVGWIIAAVVGLVALIIANWDTVSQWTQAAWSAVSAAVQAAVSFVVNIVTTAWNAVLTAISAVGSAIAAVVSFAWGLIKAYIQLNVLAIQTIINWFAGLPGMIGGWFRGAYDGAVSALGSLLGWLGGLPGRILSALGNLGSLLLNAGSDIISGLWNGIKSMGSWLEGKILDFVKSFVPGPVLHFLGISSPSKLFADMGRWIPAGLAQGIDGAASMASDATGRLASTVAKGMTVPNLAGVTLSGPTGAYGGANSLASSGGPPMVHIEQFNATPTQSPADIAQEMSWLGKGGG
jgi:hypothetical protein